MFGFPYFCPATLMVQQELEVQVKINTLFSAGAKKGMSNAKRPTELQKYKSPEDQEAYMLPAFKMFIEKW